MCPSGWWRRALGARRGELLACRWPDLDWNTCRLRIERSLYQVKEGIGNKPTKGRRAWAVAVPPSLMAYLQLHREQQQQHRAMFGPDYRTDLDLILARPDGSHMLPDSVSISACRLARRAGLRGVGLHTLRHTHASALLYAGVPITSVAARLGHRDAYTTAKVYAHALPDTDQDVAEKWDQIMSPKADAEPVAQNGTTSGKEQIARH